LTIFIFATGSFGLKANLEEHQRKSSHSKALSESLIEVNIVKNKKENIKELDLLAKSFIERCFYNRALDVYDKILRQKPPRNKIFEYYVIIGDLYNLKKDYNLSLEYYKKALYIHKNNVEVMVKIGKIFFEENFFERAEKMFLDALKIDKKSIKANRGLGDLFYKQGIYAKAVNYYIKIPKEFYEREIIKNMADSYKNLNKINEAIDILEPFLEKHIDYELMFDMGLIYMNIDNYEKAKEWLLKSLEVKSNNFKNCIYLASLYDLTGDHKKAIDLFNKAYNLDSSYASVDFMRAGLAYRTGRIREAKIYANESYKKAKSVFVKNQAKKLIEFLNRK
jgi:tetratricopeptide (TPR) repeat protein